MGRNFEIKSPDGKTYEVSTPDGADQSQINSFIADQMTSMQSKAGTEAIDITPFMTFLSSMAPAGITSAVYGAKEALPELFRGEGGAAADTYRTQRDFARKGLDTFAKQNPRAALLGQMVPGVVAGAMGLPNTIPISAAWGGTQAAMDSKADLTKLDPSQIKQFARDVGTGTALGGAFGAAGIYAPKSMAGVALGAGVGTLISPENGALPGAAVGLLGRGASSPALRSYLVKKFGNVALNTPEFATETYLQRPKEVLGQRPVSELHEEISQTILAKRDAVTEAQNVFNSAQAEFNDAKSALRISGATKRAEKRGQMDLAERKLEDAYQFALETKKQTENPNEMATQVRTAVGNLRQKAIDIEEDATQTIVDEGVTVSIPALLLKARKIKKSFGVGQKKDIFVKGGLEAEKEMNDIESVLIKLSGSKEERTNEISGADARVILKNINNHVKFLEDSGFISEGHQALTQFRHKLRGSLIVKSTAYKEKMEQAAEAFKLLSKANQFFGTDQRATSSLSSITNPNNKPKRIILTQLGQDANLDFETMLTTYEDAKNLLSSPTSKRALRDALPENQGAALAGKEFSEMTAPGAEDLALQKSMELSDQSSALGQADLELQAAKGRLKPYSNLTKESIEGKLASAGRGRIAPEATISKLGKESGKNYLRELENIRAKDILTSGRAQGSRNVKLGSVIGGALGGAITRTAEGAGWGGAIGGAAGATVDKYGGNITKKSSRHRTLNTTAFCASCCTKILTSNKISDTKRNSSTDAFSPGSI